MTQKDPHHPSSDFLFFRKTVYLPLLGSGEDLMLHSSLWRASQLIFFLSLLLSLDDVQSISLVESARDHLCLSLKTHVVDVIFTAGGGQADTLPQAVRKHDPLWLIQSI